jgi:hypothetical protein
MRPTTGGVGYASTPGRRADQQVTSLARQRLEVAVGDAPRKTSVAACSISSKG